MSIKINDKNKIIELYNKFKSLDKVSECLNLSKPTISKYLKQNNIKIIGVRRKYTCNDAFFSIDTEESFYWAGFIAADGCIYKRGGSSILSLSLAEKDVDHLIKFKNVINFCGKINKNKDKRTKKSMVRVNIYSNKIIKDLEKFNIVQRKSLIYTFPEWIIEHKFVNHFMRGYFDGDGSFYTHNKKECVGQMVFSLRGTEKFLNIYKYILSKNSKLKYNKKIELNNGIYLLRTEGNTILKSICKYLYSNAHNLILLDRKYNLIKNKI